MHICEQWWLHYTGQWGLYMLLSEHVYCVTVAFKTTEQVEQQICLKLCVKLEHSSMETIQMIQKAVAMGNCWLAASSRQCTHSCIMSHAEFFGETSYHPGDSAPLQPIFSTLRLLLFPKTKVNFEREEISDCRDSGKCNRVANANWENWGRSEGAYSKRDWGIIVLCTMFFISCIFFNVSIFHNTWLGTFWTDLVHY